VTESYRLLTGEGIKEMLGELLERLSNRGVTVDAYIVGGAAMAMHLGRSELTPDVDGIFHPADEVFAEAEAMATEYNLDPQWINNRAVPFIEFGRSADKDAVRMELRGRPVVVASKRTLLAMKIAASRVKDRPDLTRLIHDLEMYDADEIVDLVFDVFGDASMVAPNDPEEVRLLANEAIHRAKLAQPAPPAGETQGREPRGTSAGGQFTEKRQSPPEVTLGR
jgi:hypothetical protein